ncbi:MAG: glycosyltransferase family 4 protein [bacterium]
MKKILFVESYPHVLFGQQRILLSMLDACPQAGLKPLVAATADGVFAEEVRRRSIELVFFPYPGLLSSYGGAIYRNRGLRFLRMVWQLVSYVLRIRLELKTLSLAGVYCNDMRALLTAGIAARSLGIPVLIWDKLDKPHGWMDWFQLPLVTSNLIISKAVARKYPDWQKYLMKNKIILAYEGADLGRIDEASAIRPQLNLEEGDIVLAIVGTITARKGHDRIFALWPELIKAFPQLRLLVVGAVSGSEEDDHFLASLPNRNDSGIQFLGMREDVPAIMKSIDVLLVPSRHEGFGLVIVEAMAASKTIIGADIGGIPEVIADGETGWVVSEDDSAAWKESIFRLASSSELRERMGKAGRNRVERQFNKAKQIGVVLQEVARMEKRR